MRRRGARCDGGWSGRRGWLLLRYIDDWRHFGRPSGVFVLKDDTLIVSDSESGFPIGGPPIAPEGGGNAVRNPGWKNGIRIGSAKDGSLQHFIPGTRPEGLAADELGNIFGGTHRRLRRESIGRLPAEVREGEWDDSMTWVQSRAGA